MPQKSSPQIILYACYDTTRHTQHCKSPQMQRHRCLKITDAAIIRGLQVVSLTITDNKHGNCLPLTTIDLDNSLQWYE